MHVLKAEISNVKAIRHLVWEIEPGRAAGWHVVLGDNGSGKSSVLRAIALALVGHENALALRQPWNLWVRNNASEATIQLFLRRHEEFDGIEGFGRRGPWNVELSIEKTLEEQDVVHGTLTYSRSFSPKGRGWFSAAYGPFRRFSGGDKDYDELITSYPRLSRHLSIFDERVALTECLEWLRDLRFQELERPEEGAFLETIRKFINQEGFLPFGARLYEVSSREITFVDGNGCRVRIEDLSDGYRSILSMTFELIRQLAREYGPERVFSPDDPPRVLVPGVVLVDEIDAHLHPTWQRRVGLWFREYFPNMQFIVTTHSPLVCQAAEVGTVFRLPQPGSSEEAAMVTGHDLERLLYGDILDAYGTGLFGQGITRSQSSRRHLERLAELNLKEINEGLSDNEVHEQHKLRAALPTAAHVLSVEDAADH